MSSPHHRHARRRLDEFVRAGYQSLHLSTRPARRMYTRLLHWVRVRSNLLTPIGDAELLERAVGAIATLARYHARYEAMPETWAGGHGNVYELVQSLAEHLLGRFEVPRCLATIWLEPVSDLVKQAREWFIAHARGERFRSIPGLPMTMTRKMERLWKSSPHHLSLRQAMRRAELLALGAKPHLVRAVLATRLGEALEHGAFWRESFQWLVRHQDRLDQAQLFEIIEFVDAERCMPMTIVTPHGVIEQPPRDPEFSLIGRNLSSLGRLMREREEELLLLQRGALEWLPSGLAGLLFREGPRAASPSPSDAPLGTDEIEADLELDNTPPTEWRIVELLDSSELRREGRVLRHCVGSYARDCKRGRSSIWSLRRRAGPGEGFVSCFTIEVRLATRTIVQVKGRFNGAPSMRPRAIIARWAEHAGLALAF